MVRLAKLIRLLRLLRADIFKDLLAMIQGLRGGATVLMWAVLLFLLIVYVMALIFRETWGEEKDKENRWGTDAEKVREYFDSVPRSMLTTFRCSFGDCNTKEGQ